MTLLLGRRLMNIGSHWHLMILWPCCFFHENVINTLFRDEKKVSQFSLWVMLSSWKGTYWLPSSHLSFQWREALQFMRFLHVCVCVLTREKHFTSIFKGGQVLTNCSSASEVQREVVAPSFVGEILVILVIPFTVWWWANQNRCTYQILNHSKWTENWWRHEWGCN